MEAPRKPKATATRKPDRSKKLDPKSTTDTKPAAWKPQKKAAASIITKPMKHITTDLVVSTQNFTSPLEEISDLFDHLPLQSCVELTRRNLT
jgi:hypothetical protein